MLYRVAKLKSDGWCMDYEKEIRLISAPNEEEAKRIYKETVKCRGRQRVQVTPVTHYGVVIVKHDDIYIGDKEIAYY